jgi:isocitrate lyase
MKIVHDFSSKRWEGIRRDYTPQDVERLGGTIEIKYTLAEMGAERLWHLLQSEPYVAALGAAPAISTKWRR